MCVEAGFFEGDIFQTKQNIGEMIKNTKRVLGGSRDRDRRTVLDFNVRIYRYPGPSKKVSVYLYNTLEIYWLDVNFSRNLRISKKIKKERKPPNSMKFTKRTMVHSKEIRESQK